ncbi:K antiporter P-type alpha subunit family protein, putative [Ichthyophthirius multifiliis]|uniref:K antiporter P-type alpha subunit family protein, putative n=1 Tax=Ichthyophthirius multifiliis TaxID=5932 RepID=G0R4V3_ICHMU|nr:K antiporter P-type alpha subunit family protein, putative [Ichthyophthirius multifiliis]EGR27496.1 K antiporter P-type alpha subunit family protein, putative [Ichthyophthirius multifiliis]|eukprot:XP_004024406.1 K antiporter P-type alpha subunit family protein, putative [Ichthyophthirius multifiliis]
MKVKNYQKLNETHNQINPNLEYQPKSESIRSSLARNYEDIKQSIDLQFYQEERKSVQINRSNSIQNFNNNQDNNVISSVNSSKKYKEPNSQYKAIQPHIDDPEEKKAQTKEAFGLMDDHRIPLEDLRKRLNTDFKQGLQEAIAIQLNQKDGDNKLTEKKKLPGWLRFFKEISNGFAILLWVCTVLCFITYGIDTSQTSNLYVAIVLMFIILLTGYLTYMQTAKSEALMEGFKNFLPQVCYVFRDGMLKQIPVEKLVIGDLVQIKAGMKIPADIRIIESMEMKVDNSPFTGETEPLLRTIDCSHPLNPLETSNLAFFGTLCTSGIGKGVVIRIGDNTTLGQIADLASSGQKVKTPLRKELDSIIGVSLGFLFFILDLLVIKAGVANSISNGIGILVANVPEGLLGCITISLAITAKKLADKMVLVKNLEAVETLGSTSCICSDKTGTLTQNVMTVKHMWYNGQIINAVNKSQLPITQDLEYDINDRGFQALHLNAILSSEAQFNIEENINREDIDFSKCPVFGDATETGLLRFYQSIEDVEKTRMKFKFAKTKEGAPARMPFNANDKFALTIVEQSTNDSDYCIYIKGAPERIWKFCKYILLEQRKVEIQQEWDRKFNDVNLRFGKGGERVLGFAKLHLLREEFQLNQSYFNVSSKINYNFKLENFTFVGLISLIDPPKTRVPHAVLECRSAGIKVIMVTGDQPPTAAAIARECNIIPRNVETNEDIMEKNPGISWDEAIQKAKAIVVHGDRIMDSLEREKEENNQELYYIGQWVKKDYCVFARTTPAQKLQIVKACQSQGYICAVTGDGVNDSPAIKQADIGISMNLSGADVTKDAADMILLDDDFASIINGVEEGRKIFDNLKKTIVYLLTSNIPQLIPFLINVIFGYPLPLSSMFVLCICVGTDILPAISLAYEEAEIDIMTRKPRKKDDHLVSAKLIIHAYLLMGLISTCGGFAAYFTTIVMLIGILVETVLCVFLFYTPGVQKIFGGRPIDFWQFGIPGLPFSMFLLLWEEIRKALIRRFKWFDRFLCWPTLEWNQNFDKQINQLLLNVQLGNNRAMGGIFGVTVLGTIGLLASGLNPIVSAAGAVAGGVIGQYADGMLYYLWKVFGRKIQE